MRTRSPSVSMAETTQIPFSPLPSASHNRLSFPVRACCLASLGAGVPVQVSTRVAGVQPPGAGPGPAHLAPLLGPPGSSGLSFTLRLMEVPAECVKATWLCTMRGAGHETSLWVLKGLRHPPTQACPLGETEASLGAPAFPGRHPPRTQARTWA